ncbi:radical SAM family heme chaperone HemW [Candidatus Babeliales bacterium]|nr:radical SAM family heme chaperone HemW [Candidatus Babeliales bacterium]
MMNNEQKLFSLYIHWPFCSTKCNYCDFVAFEQHQDFQEAYHHALLKEIEHFVATNPLYHPDITTIFIGGGTPSLYPLEYMSQLFDTLKKHFNFSGIKELSMEANPADISEERLDAWDSFGINRLSMGVQVLDDNVLLKLNRRQRTADVHNALRMIPKYFNNFSMDFILGLPGVSDSTWDASITCALESQAKHVSVYFLMVHEKTPLYFEVKKGNVKLKDDMQIIAQHEHTIARLTAGGFEQYEISNFARPGYASIHNQAYWERLPYQGFGIGACSFDGTQRFMNEKNLTTYLTNVFNKNFENLSTCEKLTPDQEKLEMLMLGLRQNKGVGLHRVVYCLDKEKKQRIFDTLELLKSQGLIVQNNDQIRLTLKGMALENEIILKLI